MTPDQRDVPGTEESRPAGPVGAGDPPPPAVAKASSGEVPPTRPPAGGGHDSSGSEAVEHDLDALLSERDEYLDLAKRTKADFENFRKRMGAEVLVASGRGKAEVLRDVLPV